MKKINRFIVLAGLPPDRIEFQRIDYLYVPPIEYDDIAKTLSEENIVFITGTKEKKKRGKGSITSIFTAPA